MVIIKLWSLILTHCQKVAVFAHIEMSVIKHGCSFCKFFQREYIFVVSPFLKTYILFFEM